jgi:hypothetical protein
MRNPYSENNLVFPEMVSAYARSAMRVTPVFKSDRCCVFSFWLAAALGAIWDRISNPKVGSDGVQPKPDDFRLVVGVGAHF